MIKYCESYESDIRRIISVIPDIEKLRDKTVLITGAGGLICSSLADVLLYLNRSRAFGINIILAGRSRERMIKRFSDFEEGVSYRFYEFDASGKNALDISCDYIIHGASNASPAAYIKEPVETMLANFTGLNSLLENAVKNKVSRVMYVSSSEVYGNKTGTESYRETDYGFVDILNPRAAYPDSKRAAETLCIAYGEEYGMDTVIVRPGHIYGAAVTDSDDRASAQFTRSAAAKENIIMKSRGMQRRSYCYVLDCASAMITVLLKGESGNAYNISNPDSIVTISDIAAELAEQAGTELIYQEADSTEKKGYNLMTDSSLNSEKLESLGWKACFSLEEGVKRTLELYCKK